MVVVFIKVVNIIVNIVHINMVSFILFSKFHQIRSSKVIKNSYQVSQGQGIINTITMAITHLTHHQDNNFCRFLFISFSIFKNCTNFIDKNTLISLANMITIIVIVQAKKVCFKCTSADNIVIHININTREFAE